MNMKGPYELRILLRNMFIIYSDSLSCMKAIKYQKYEHPLIQDILIKCHNLICNGKAVVFCWVHSHIGIEGNSLADAAAKEALNDDVLPVKFPYSDLKPCILNEINNSWQSFWDEQSSNKLQRLQPTVGTKRPRIRGRRRDVVIQRLRIGHTYLTHCYLLKGEPPPECVPCQEPLTVEHILLRCVDFQQTRERHFKATTLRELFNSTPVEKILDYLSDINLVKSI